MDAQFKAVGLGFADDIVAIGYGEEFVPSVIKTVRDCCVENNTKLN